MIRTIVAAAVALGMLGLSTGAKALPDEPLTSVPLVYDANDTLVGPYSNGVTYIKIGTQIYALNVEIDKLVQTADDQDESWPIIYYSDRKCAGEAFARGRAGYRVLLAPKVIVKNERLFVPNGAPRMVEIKSAKNLRNPSKDNCSKSSGLQEMVPLTKMPVGSLGITFPLRLEVPGVPTRTR